MLNNRLDADFAYSLRRIYKKCSPGFDLEPWNPSLRHARFPLCAIAAATPDKDGDSDNDAAKKREEELAKKLSPAGHKKGNKVSEVCALFALETRCGDPLTP